ncbi:cupin domain-containing protein [Alsobacter sp. KACC 23698]|uniref:Cupin domain-containing protein n=1 Tax=Alsobacter sp. KACC 23698 TaxID=3149229 RepID=A0AAU7JIV1_9HYPH
MAQHRSAPGEVVDLSPLGPALSSAKTTALVKTEAFEAVRLVIKAGAEIATHQVAGPITLHCLEGRVTLDLPGDSIELAPGSWIHLAGGAPHSLRAAEDASLLLTIMFAR